MKSVVALDTETGLIKPGCLAPPLVCVTYAHEDGSGILHVKEARDTVAGLLVSDCVLVGHNIAYDMAVIAGQWPDLLPAIFAKYERDEITDTMLRELLWHIANGSNQKKAYSLAACVERHGLGVMTGKEGVDAWRKRYIELIDTPIAWWPEAATSYAIGDAVKTRELYFDQMTQHPEYLADEYRQGRAAWWLHLMACWGLKTDPKAVEVFAAELEEEHAEIAATLRDEKLMRDDGSRDTKAAQARLVEAWADNGLAEVLTPTGKPKLDRATCEASGDDVLAAYGRVSSLKKQLSTDVPLLREGVHTPIQPRFQPLLATGRTSSRPNVQNLPRKGSMRECFVPRPGYVYASADYGQFELRTVAQVCLDLDFGSALGKALNEGKDPHLGIAAQLLDLSYEEALAARKDPKVNNARQVGKVANFGFPGGLGILRFVHFASAQYGVEVTEDGAANLKATWLDTWGEFREYFRYIGKICEGHFAQIKHLKSNRFRGGVTFCEACNSYFQGMAADAAKHAGFLISRACYIEKSSPLYGCRPVNFIHDEFILEAPEAQAAEAAEELARLMCVGANKFLRDVPATAEPLLMRRWCKNAEPVYENGRLIPWAPQY